MGKDTPGILRSQLHVSQLGRFWRHHKGETEDGGLCRAGLRPGVGCASWSRLAQPEGGPWQCPVRVAGVLSSDGQPRGRVPRGRGAEDRADPRRHWSCGGGRSCGPQGLAVPGDTPPGGPRRGRLGAPGRAPSEPRAGGRLETASSRAVRHLRGAGAEGRAARAEAPSA